MRGGQFGTPLPYLAAWRHYEYLSQAALADLAGISTHTIKCLETARYHGASRTTVLALAQALHITARQLAEQEPPQPNKAIAPDASILAALEPFVAHIVRRVMQELQSMKTEE